MGDKIQRLVSVTNRSVSLIDNESLRDTLIYLHNYAAMAIMLIDETNKNKTTNEKYDFNRHNLIMENLG
jgi:hypothetical protein